MSLRPAKIILPLALLTAVCAVEAGAQQTVKAPAVSGKEAAKTTQAAPQQPAQSGGLVVFIDPVTGQIRQPDAAEIGTLSGTTATPNAGGANAPAVARRPVTRPVEFRGAGGAAGVKLGEDTLSYMVVTKTPDGKLAEDCVTGDKAAAAALSQGVAPKTTASPKKAKEVLDDK